MLIQYVTMFIIIQEGNLKIKLVYEKRFLSIKESSGMLRWVCNLYAKFIYSKKTEAHVFIYYFVTNKCDSSLLLSQLSGNSFYSCTIDTKKN